MMRRRRSPLLERLRSRRRRRGVAMILVLGALAILTVMLTEAQDDSSSDFSATIAARDQLAAEYAAKSAINLSRLLIAAEPTIRQSAGMLLSMLYGGTTPQLPVWEYADEVLGAFNDQAGKEAFASLSGLDLSEGEHLGLEGASFDVDVIDEDSKINVNLAVRETFSKQRLMLQLIALTAGPQYDGLFSARDADGQFSDRQTICSALIDWSDSDQDMWPCDGSETAQQTGPEDSYYERLDQPYTRKNAAFDSLMELYRVRGVSEDFWSTFVEPDPDDPRSRVMTVWGQGAVNVNSANAQVLLALICQQAEPNTKVCDGGEGSMQFLAMFSMLKSVTQGAPLFGSPKVFVQTIQGGALLGPMLVQAGIEPVKLKSPGELEKQLTTESKVFSIYAKGFVRVGKRESSTRIHTVVDFRQAPPPGEATTAGEVQKQVEAAQAIDAALKPSAAGALVYYRVD